MFDKKLEFDLRIRNNPKEVLIEIIEKAGYTYFDDCPQGDVDCCILTNEYATNKNDVFKFIENVNNVSGLKLEILFEDEIDEMGEVDYHTEDGMFGGIVCFKENEHTMTTPSDMDTHFRLAYSSEGMIFS